MKIGLLSDTHSYLDPRVFDHFQFCDEIWHAGDIGNIAVADALQEFKPLRGVFGNIDDKQLQIRFPEDARFVCEELSIWITHIGGKPPHYNSRVKTLLMASAPDIFICGHSHVLQVSRDKAFHNMLFLNPGAAGNHGFHPVKTLLRFEILGREVKGMEAIELGARGGR